MAMSDMRKTIFGHSTPMGELPRGRAKTLRYGFRPQTRKADTQPDVELYERYVILCRDVGGTVDAGALYWTPLRLTAVVNGMLRRIERKRWEDEKTPIRQDSGNMPSTHHTNKRDTPKEYKHYPKPHTSNVNYYPTGTETDVNDRPPF